jgi:hypothetical protein
MWQLQCRLTCANPCRYADSPCFQYLNVYAKALFDFAVDLLSLVQSRTETR